MGVAIPCFTASGQHGDRGYCPTIEDDEWGEYAEGWDQDEAARAYASAAFSSLMEEAETYGLALAGADVIDFGCGTGLLTDRLVSAGAAVHAVDTSQAMLDVLDRKISECGWTNVATSRELPTTTRVYDLIVCSSVCSFLDDYPGTVADLISLLRPDGLFVQWDWERSAHDSGGLSRDEITDALNRAGLVNVSAKTGFVVSVGNNTMSPLMGVGQRP